MMKTWDAIVIGAGPAGCAAAYDLAGAGRAVLLLDRCNFPRQKACAGGLTMKTVRALRYGIDRVTREVISSIVLEQDGSNRTVVKRRVPICVMTVRSELDHYCFQKTLDAGAAFLKVRGIKAVEHHEGGVVIDTGDELLEGRFVVGADGVNSQVRRLCPVAGTVAGGFAIEGQVQLKPEPVSLTFDFGAVRNGYGWIFPKGDHLNVGLGYYGESGKDKINRERLIGYARRKLGTDRVDHVAGQYLGVGTRDTACSCGRVLFAGDAAGLVDPLTAEGIYGAVISGQAAAKAIDVGLSGIHRGAEQEGFVASTYREGLAGLRDALAFSTRAAASFYLNPDRGFRALTLPGFRSALVRTYSEGMNASILFRILRGARSAY